MKLAAILLAVAACRTEPAAEPPAPPQVAQATPPPSETKDDRTLEDQLPPSLYEANRGAPPKPAKADKPDKAKPSEARAKPLRRLAPIRADLCVTTGAAKVGAKIGKPAMRAVAKGTDGDAASMTFTFEGETEEVKKLSSGEARRQLGLKLRAENGCNLIYVMWRLDPKPMINAQVKRNPGAKDHKGCGASGYKWIKATQDRPPPELVVGTKYTLRAEIANDELAVYVDDTLYWRGAVPENARDLRGPAGMRSDNLAFDLHAFEAGSTDVAAGNAKCVDEDRD